VGFRAVLAEGADRVLGWRSPNYVYAAATAPGLRLLARNYRLSDDVAFRFSERSWTEWPLTTDKSAGEGTCESRRWRTASSRTCGEIGYGMLDLGTCGADPEDVAATSALGAALRQRLAERGV